MDINQIRQIVIEAAREELLPRFTRVSHEFTGTLPPGVPEYRPSVHIKADGSFLTEADLAVQNRIARALKQLSPAIAFLGEEMPASEQQALLEGDAPLWCLDPLDGTSNFANGIPFFSVSLALLEKGRVVLGVVYDPSRDECFSAELGKGAWLNETPLHTCESHPSLARCTATIDFKRLAPALATRLACEAPYSSQRSFGSVALDWCWIAAGRGQLYLHGKQNLWDYAAGTLILAEAGGHACTLQGEAVMVPRLEKRSAVAATSQDLFTAWTAWLGVV